MNIIQLSKNRYGLGIILISDRFTQCQVTLRNKLKNSSNQNIVEIYDITKGKNIIYDQSKSTQEVINDIRNGDAIDTSTFTKQALVIKVIFDNTDKKHTNAWHKALSTLPTNIYSFSFRYFNNTLANHTNLSKWGFKNFDKCDICDENKILGNVAGGCKTAPDEKRYNWRHD